LLWYSPQNYDSITTAAGWAQETVAVHTTDRREYIYTQYQLEHAQTHDDLWNASQLQLTREGKLHGFLRMYWAKKILQWTISPTQALDIAQYLNDYYAIDGRCPNGFVGVGWSIMGIHDQGWKEREVFGKIRFMNYQGCQRKFKVATLVDKYPPAAANAAKAAQQQQQHQQATTKSKSNKKTTSGSGGGGGGGDEKRKAKDDDKVGGKKEVGGTKKKKNKTT
jgi:deoxyribodipyrimidine photo-lyase